MGTLLEEALDTGEYGPRFVQPAPPAGDAVSAPARRPPEPPTDPDKAPHGWTYRGGEWRPKRPAGRPRKVIPPKVINSTAATRDPVAAKSKKPPAADHRKELVELADSAIFLMSSVPIPDVLFGYDMRGLRVKIRAQAAITKAHTPAVPHAVNEIAKHNDWIARIVESASSGKSGVWVMPVLLALAPFAVQTAALWTSEITADLVTTAKAVEDQAAAFIGRVAAAATAPPAASDVED